ncbi:hypothetical protein [Methylobacterium oryzae]|uniref:Uncharacterized protein n=1 Tax=Methylobacterium oryzae TaxID=334852 RepID=A0ABU7TX92_9HYPH
MADRIIEVRHPATIRRADDDGTGRDVSWLACTTPVRLRERDPAAFRLVQRHAKPYWDMPYEVYACDGKLWGRLDGRSRFAPDEPGVRVEHLLAFLQGHPCDQSQGNELEWAFAGTPVLAIDGHDLQRGSAATRRPRVASAVLDRAAADVTAFVEGSVAISDGRVMVCGPGLLLARDPSSSVQHRDEEWTIMPWREYRPAPGRTYRPGDLDEAVAFEDEATGYANLTHGVLDDVWLDEGHDAGDGDIVETINGLPRLIHAMVRRRLLGRIPVAERLEVVQFDGGILSDAMRRLGPWYVRATTGAVGVEDAVEAISACEGVVEALTSVIPHERQRLHLDEIGIAFRWFRERMAPRIQARMDAGNDADMAALSALS